MEDFESATICDSIPLVSATKVIVPMFNDPAEKEFPLSPTACALIVALIIFGVTIAELVIHKRFWGFDLVLLLLIGFCGLILTTMFFSEHPTVKINLQILLLNPLAAVCLWPVVRNERKGRSHWFWKAYAVCLVLFLLGNFVQCYAEGTNILASSLLIWSSANHQLIKNRNNQRNPNNQKS